MRIPVNMPARNARSVGPPAMNAGSRPPASEAHVAPAACCAEACVDVPFVGRVCHCLLDLPICP